MGEQDSCGQRARTNEFLGAGWQTSTEMTYLPVHKSARRDGSETTPFPVQNSARRDVLDQTGPMLVFRVRSCDFSFRCHLNEAARSILFNAPVTELSDCSQFNRTIQGSRD